MMDPQRVARAAAAIRDGKARVEPTGDGRFRVASFTGEDTYTVRLEPEPRCTCPDVAFRGVETCKHIAAALLMGGLNTKETA